MLHDYTGEIRLRLSLKAASLDDAERHLLSISEHIEEIWNRDADREDPSASFITGSSVGSPLRVK